MAYPSIDREVSQTTEWVKLNPDRNPFQTVVQIVVPAGVTVDWTLEGLNQPNLDPVNSDEIIVFDGFENITETKLAYIVAPTGYVRIVINSISGGVGYIKVKIVQSGTSYGDDNEIG